MHGCTCDLEASAALCFPLFDLSSNGNQARCGVWLSEVLRMVILVQLLRHPVRQVVELLGSDALLGIEIFFRAVGDGTC